VCRSPRSRTCRELKYGHVERHRARTHTNTGYRRERDLRAEHCACAHACRSLQGEPVALRAQQLRGTSGSHTPAPVNDHDGLELDGARLREPDAPVGEPLKFSRAPLPASALLGSPARAVRAARAGLPAPDHAPPLVPPVPLPASAPSSAGSADGGVLSSAAPAAPVVPLAERPVCRARPRRAVGRRRARVRETTHAVMCAFAALLDVQVRAAACADATWPALYVAAFVHACMRHRVPIV
jgi:hypothetical protein